jgi:hypothetical protein
MKVTLMGGSPVAATLAGINAQGLTILLFVISAVMGGIGGVFNCARLSQGALTALSTNQFTGLTAAILGGISFGVYMAIIFVLAWAQFSPALSIVKAVLITIIGTSTLSSSMYSIYIAFGKKLGLLINLVLIIGWQLLIPLGVMGMWTLMASVRIYFVVAGILFAIGWHLVEKRKGVASCK